MDVWVASVQYIHKNTLYQQDDDDYRVQQDDDDYRVQTSIALIKLSLTRKSPEVSPLRSGMHAVQYIIIHDAA